MSELYQWRKVHWQHCQLLPELRWAKGETRTQTDMPRLCRVPEISETSPKICDARKSLNHHQNEIVTIWKSRRKDDFRTCNCNRTARLYEDRVCFFDYFAHSRQAAAGFRPWGCIGCRRLSISAQALADPLSRTSISLIIPSSSFSSSTFRRKSSSPNS